MTQGSYEPGFRLALHDKDLGICQAMAQDKGVELPICDMTREHYQQLMAQGHGDEFEKIKGEHLPGVITGKPLAIGGSEGRSYSTAMGGYYCLREAVKEGTSKGEPPSEPLAAELML